MSNGKGSKPRPMSISYSEYEKRWEEAFRKQKNKAKEKKDNDKTNTKAGVQAFN